MRNIILLFFLSVTSGMAAAQSRTDSLYSLLDEAIANSDRYVEKREGYIRHTRGMYANAGMAARYSLALELYKEYSAYMSDSALVWLERAATIARRLGDGAGENRCRVLKAYLCSSTGMYTEAVDMLASVRKEKLGGAGLLDYYMSCSHLYGELAYYTKVDELRKKYLAMSRLYSDTLIAIAPADNDYRLLALEKRAYGEGDYAKALSYNDRRMRLAAKGSHGMAIVAFYRYLDYKMLGDNERWNYWLAVSALNDVRNAVMDQGGVVGTRQCHVHKGRPTTFIPLHKLRLRLRRKVRDTPPLPSDNARNSKRGQDVADARQARERMAEDRHRRLGRLSRHRAVAAFLSHETASPTHTDQV